MVYVPTTPLTAYLSTAGAGLYKSTNDGTSWTESGLAGLIVPCLEVAPDDPTTLYTSTDGSGSVYLTTNAGSTWTSLNLPSSTTNDLAISPAAPSILFAATGNGIYKYNGAWSASGLEGLHVTTIPAHPSNTKILYDGKTSGAYTTTNAGTTWQEGPSELKGVWVNSIQINPNDPVEVFFTTYGHGVLRLSP